VRLAHVNTFGPPTETPRDPIAGAIEIFLEELQTKGEGVLRRAEIRQGWIRLSFGEAMVEAEAYDIALVRLANAMLDDVRYTQALTLALRAPIHAVLA
jgi:hypothetical protein